MLWLAMSVHADTPAFTSGGATPEPPPSFTGTRGWTFYVSSPATGISITQLGVFDFVGDGLINSHQIGLWTTDGALLASVLIPAGLSGSFVGGYRYMPIEPLFIPAGFNG